MTSQTTIDHVGAADEVVDELISAALENNDRGRITRAPAGAGKTGAVVRLVGSLAEADARVGVVSQTNEQAFDIVDRISADFPDQHVSFLHATDIRLPQHIAERDNVSMITSKNLASAELVVATGHKWADVAPQLVTAEFDNGVVDEMYQMSSSMLLRISDTFGTLDALGDPGQLDPFTIVDDERWAGLASDPTLNAVDAVLAHHPTTRIRNLPVTRRLSPAAAEVVSDAFYPTLEFGPASGPEDRELTLARGPKGSKAIRPTLETAAETGWALHELPAKVARKGDAEVAAALADLARAFVQSEPKVVDEKLDPGEHDVGRSRIAIGVSHNEQKAAVLVELQRRRLGEVVVDTANRLQGREFDVLLVWHPLSGRVDASDFHLDSGRLCVLTTRHRHACVVVARAGIQELLHDHPPPGSFRLGYKRDRAFEGWEAHASVLRHLRRP